MEEKNKTNLKKKIIKEYIYIALITIYILFIQSNLFDFLLGDNTGIDGIGSALGIALILRIALYAIAAIFFIINPIRILISCKSEFKAILSRIKRILYYTIVILPIVFGLLIILEIPISNYIYDQKYNTSKSSYSIDYNDYKSAKEFEKELYERGLLYNEDYEELLLKLNRKYDIQTQSKKYYYEEASLMTLFSNTFYDSKDENEIISFDSYKKAPVYIYNSILTLPSEGENLQYAPISRYDEQNYLRGNYYPFYEDYYIECKILYVDGDIYAIIGVSECYNINSYFRNNKEKYNINNYYDYPSYYMILSEKDTITTFVDDQYHSDGAIENNGWRFEMKLNTAETSYSVNYPIRKVDKLDVDTINNIAQELKEGILKESIEYHIEQSLK